MFLGAPAFYEPCLRAGSSPIGPGGKSCNRTAARKISMCNKMAATKWQQQGSQDGRNGKRISGGLGVVGSGSSPPRGENATENVSTQPMSQENTMEETIACISSTLRDVNTSLASQASCMKE
jgi:hypothetical protein